MLRTILRHCLKTTSLFLPLPYTDYRYLGIFNIMISLYYVNGRGRRNRTLISGFGDRHSTVELYPYNTNSFLYKIRDISKIEISSDNLVGLQGLEPGTYRL